MNEEPQLKDEDWDWTVQFHKKAHRGATAWGWIARIRTGTSASALREDLEAIWQDRRIWCHHHINIWTMSRDHIFVRQGRKAYAKRIHNWRFSRLSASAATIRRNCKKLLKRT